MRLSLETVSLLANDFECPETTRVFDRMIEKSFDHFILNDKKKKKEKLYFTFFALNGKVFLRTEKRFI